MGAPSEAVHHPYLRVVGPWGVTLPPHLLNRVTGPTSQVGLKQILGLQHSSALDSQ